MDLPLSEARLRARAAGDFAPLIARVPYAAWIGITGCIEPDGALKLTLPFKPMLVGNPVLPAIHGGVIAGFMESAAMLDLLLRIDEDRVPKSIDFSIDYLRSARAVDSHASCAVERLGRRVAQVQIRCWQDDEAAPVAVARAHFLLAEPG